MTPSHGTNNGRALANSVPTRRLFYPIARALMLDVCFGVNLLRHAGQSICARLLGALRNTRMQFGTAQNSGGLP